MKWDEFNPHSDCVKIPYERTDIECPECGEKVFRFTGTVLTTYPPMYRYDCKKCGWRGVK